MCLVPPKHQVEEEGSPMQPIATGRPVYQKLDNHKDALRAASQTLCKSTKAQGPIETGSLCLRHSLHHRLSEKGIQHDRLSS